MRKIDRLRQEALQACNFRGHNMKTFEYGYTDSTVPVFGYSECTTCGAWVQVDTDPAPNGIDIGGPAVAISCPAESCNHA